MAAGRWTEAPAYLDLFVPRVHRDAYRALVSAVPGHGASNADGESRTPPPSGSLAGPQPGPHRRFWSERAPTTAGAVARVYGCHACTRRPGTTRGQRPGRRVVGSAFRRTPTAPSATSSSGTLLIVRRVPRYNPRQCIVAFGAATVRPCTCPGHSTSSSASRVPPSCSAHELPSLRCAACTGTATAQTLPSEPMTFAGGRVVLGGDAGCTFGSDDEGYFNYGDYDHSTLREVRIGLSAQVRANRRISVLAEVRVREPEGTSRHLLCTCARAHFRAADSIFRRAAFPQLSDAFPVWRIAATIR